jgi:uncharacterized membrane protein (DUF106 family)
LIYTIFQGAISSWLLQPPGITILTLILAICINVASAIITQLSTNQAELTRMQAAIDAHVREKKRLEKLQQEDPLQYQKEFIKWKRLEKPVQKMQQRIALARAKPSLITCVPILVLFAVLNVYFTGVDVALAPMNVWHLGNSFTNMFLNYVKGAHNGWINFQAWYFLSSFAMGTIIPRLFGTAQPFNTSNLFAGGQMGISPLRTQYQTSRRKTQKSSWEEPHSHLFQFPLARTFSSFAAGLSGGSRGI